MIEKKLPMRRCIGCMQSRPKEELIRILPTGRGAYICKDEKCLNKALKKNAVFRNLGVELTEKQIADLKDRISNSHK